MITAETKLNKIIPVLGLGTWEITGKNCSNCVSTALRLGYRHIDTAQMYRNEDYVGKGIKQSGLLRDDIFITTKIATGNLTPSRIRLSFIESLKKLETEYIDLLLIHWPTASMNLKACLDTMFELVEDNVLNFVGVSNFSSQLFEEAQNYGPVVNNQVVFNPYEADRSILDSVKRNGKTLTAYSPLARGKVYNDDRLKKIGKEHGKTAGQVSLRWLLQLGDISVIPKASSEDHQFENLDIFDFELNDEEMKQISGISYKE